MLTTIEKLNIEYFELMSLQQFQEADMDYSLLEKHRNFLSSMAQIDNSAITIFDLNKREHVFASYNFRSLFGYDMDRLEKENTGYFNSKIHPDDFPVLLKQGIKIFEYFLSVSPEQRIGLKAINEYRVLNAENKFIRVIEQHQALEMDKKGNLWLSLSVIDISPNQDPGAGVRCQVINFMTGKLIILPAESKSGNPNELSSRERQVLGMIKEGLLSKEISEKLFISVHTVNTHRQRILGKLNANNSQEAIKYASVLGLLD